MTGNPRNVRAASRPTRPIPCHASGSGSSCLRESSTLTATLSALVRSALWNGLDVVTTEWSEGPGSPAFIWVNARHQKRFWQPLSGWWSHAAPFDMADAYTPGKDINRFLYGTQPITALAMVETGLDITLDAADALRAKSLKLTDLFISLVEQRCGNHPLELITPRDHATRCSHVSIRHPEGYAVMSALIARGVIGDYREPEVLRFGITPLYLGYADVWDAVEILRDILDTRAWDADEFKQRNTVT